ncbi:MAG: response regulator [bacterium]
MSKRILFVDDEDWSVSPYFEILQDQEIEVDLAEDGDKAIGFLRKNPYDLIVLDVMFAPGTIMGDNVEPRKAGSTLLSKIRNKKISGVQTKSDIPVLVLTAVTDQKLLNDIREMKIAELCRKPAAFEQVIDKVSRILGVKQ